MGIWKHKGNRVPRDPVVLINDPSLSDSSLEHDLEPDSRPPWRGDLIAELRPDESGEAPPPGSPTYIMCWAGEPPAVWVDVPKLRRLGYLTGPNADVVAAFVRGVHGGLRAAIANQATQASPGGLWVRIPGQRLQDG